MTNLEKQKEIMQKMVKSPLFFIKTMWKLTPTTEEDEFMKGKHITWQQTEILESVERAIRGGKKRITVSSGHGVGKSAVLSWIVIWYLFTHKNAQVPCTAPTTEQMHDVLWKEISLWISRMPKEIQGVFSWTRGYLRITESPNTWFARAKTARKEAPEALAGVHGEYVLFAIDEASGVPTEIFNVAEGALTGENVIVIMISNPTRLEGYFYDSHHKDKHNWDTFQFNSEESPIVDDEFVERIIEKHGKDSDEYKIRVKGIFPREDAIDDKGYVPLLLEKDLNFGGEDIFASPKMGIDPAGQGKDETIWVVRDNFKAQIVAKEKVSDSKTIARKTITLMEFYNIEGKDVFVDNFGVGANVAVEIALAGEKVNGVNVGEQALDKETFLNLRAEKYWRLKKWITNGGELVGTEEKWKQLLTIKYRRNLRGKLQIKSKDEMRRDGLRSPDRADALMLTFEEAKPKKSIHIYRPPAKNSGGWSNKF